MSPLPAEEIEISVVIATYNRWHILEHTLPSLLGQDYRPTRYEIVLVVDGSTDGTAERARTLATNCGFEVVEQQNRGPAAARNTGIAAASGKVVLFMDDDIRCEPGLIREHAAAHMAEPGVRVQGAIFVARESPPTLAAWATHNWYEQYHVGMQQSESAGANWEPYLNANSSVGADLLQELGGFDESVPTREDIELTLRMAESGVISRYRPRALAYEIFVKSTRQLVRDGLGYGRAEIEICRKHPQYRPESVLAPGNRAQLSPLRVVARRAWPRLPRRASSLLDGPVNVAERLASRPRARKAGIRLLELQQRMVLVRSAREAVGSAGSLEAEFDVSLPVLLYHRVGPPAAGLHPGLTLHPERFACHIDWLARRGFSTISPHQWLAWRDRREPLPPRPLLITFDDAFADLGEHALPVVRQHGMTAVVFVVTGQLGGLPAWDMSAGGPEPPRLMTAEAIRHWRDEGIHFGAHTQTHRDLRAIAGDELVQEVQGSRMELERLLDTPVICFAYPYGHYGPRASRLVAESYGLAFTVELGINQLSTAPELLRRIPVAPTHTLFDLAWSVRFGKAPLARLRMALKIRTRARLLGARVLGRM